MREFEFYTGTENPLDGVEEVLSSSDLLYERKHDNEISVDIEAKKGSYHILFNWNEGYGTMGFSCSYEDIVISKENRILLPEILLHINSSLWIGHFGLDMQTNSPVFFYSTLMNGSQAMSCIEHSGKLIENAIIICESFHHIFELMSFEEKLDYSTIGLAMTSHMGRS